MTNRIALVTGASRGIGRACALALALGGIIAAAIVRSSGHLPPPAASGAMTSTRELSKLLFSEFVYPFELTSFLILVAILGAIVLAQREN